MNIALLLFTFETELADQLDGATSAGLLDEPTAQALTDLLGHAHAVSMLPGLDQESEMALDRARVSAACAVDAGDDGGEWDEQD